MALPENLSATYSDRPPVEPRFNNLIMGTNLTAECARHYAADYDDPEKRIAEGKNPGKGADSVQADVESGKVKTSFELFVEEQRAAYLAKSGQDYEQ